MKFSTIAVLMCTLIICPGMAKPDKTKTAPDEADVIVYREAGGQKLHMHIFQPERNDASEPASAILLFHGGGWMWGDVAWTDPAAHRFAQLGMVAISVEYRLSNDQLTPVDALADTRAAFRWTRKHATELNIDPDRIAGYGVSAGGHLVAAAATITDREETDHELRATPDLLLLWSPALDVANDGWFRKLIKGNGTPSDYSPAEHAGAGTPPTCIVHGEKDTLTPLAGVMKYAKRVKKSGGICQLNIYEDVGHLLTRNLENQEDDFDPDPEKRADGIEKLNRFLWQQGYIR